MRCPRCDGAGREPLPLPDGHSTIPCPGADADPPGCDGTGVVSEPDDGARRGIASRPPE